MTVCVQGTVIHRVVLIFSYPAFSCTVMNQVTRVFLLYSQCFVAVGGHDMYLLKVNRVYNPFFMRTACSHNAMFSSIQRIEIRSVAFWCVC